MTLTIALWTALAANALMPPEQQNALVQKYCTVCHTDALQSGGLSLVRFDAAHVDPSLAAMMVSKLKNGAISASGAQPEKSAAAALLEALTAASAAAHDWTVTRNANIIQAGIERDSGSRSYRVLLTCDTTTNVGRAAVAWSPQPAQGTIIAKVDSSDPLKFRVDGEDAASVTLTGLPLPARTLTISGLFAGDSVAFPFYTGLDPVRPELSRCFNPR